MRARATTFMSLTVLLLGWMFVIALGRAPVLTPTEVAAASDAYADDAPHFVVALTDEQVAEVRESREGEGEAEAEGATRLLVTQLFVSALAIVAVHFASTSAEHIDLGAPPALATPSLRQASFIRSLRAPRPPPSTVHTA